MGSIPIKIETYWNVNARYFQAYQFSYLIKIETYRNVNLNEM